MEVGSTAQSTDRVSESRCPQRKNPLHVISLRCSSTTSNLSLSLSLSISLCPTSAAVFWEDATARLLAAAPLRKRELNRNRHPRRIERRLKKSIYVRHERRKNLKISCNASRVSPLTGVVEEDDLFFSKRVG